MRTLVLTLLVILVCLLRVPKVLSYNVSVVEYMYNYNDNLQPAENLQRNIIAHVNIIRLLKGKSEIVVFPEGSLCPDSGSNANLYFNIPDPSYSVTEFKEKVLNTLSNAAKYSQIYVVISLPERSGKYRYSTSFVLRRNGTIAAKYRKYHLYNEDVDRTNSPDLAYFDTDFGIRFGLLTSLDLIFKSPAQDLINQNITFFVYPSSWTSALPYLVGNQIQQSWSWANGVTLLAAGLNRVRHGQTGSGIFRGRGSYLTRAPFKYYMSNTPTTVIITGSLFEDDFNNDPSSSQGPLDSFNLERFFMRNRVIASSFNRNFNQEVEKLDSEPDLLSLDGVSFKNFQSELLAPDSKCTLNTTYDPAFYRCDIQRRICDGNFCCDFDITVKYLICDSPCHASTYLPNLNTDNSFFLFRYRMAVMNGVTKPWKGGDTLGMQVCSIVSCLDSDISSCGKKPDPSKYKINTYYLQGYSTKITGQSISKVNITGYFTVNSSTMIMPNLLLGVTEPTVNDFNRFGVLSNNFNFNTNGNTSQIYLPDQTRNLGAVAIINRIFSRDGFPARSSQSRQSSSLNLILLFSATFYIFIQGGIQHNYLLLT